MSQETKNICNIRYITDCDTELYSCGDVDGAFDQDELDKYLSTYRENGKLELLEKMAFLQKQILESWARVNFKEEWAVDCQKYYNNKG